MEDGQYREAGSEVQKSLPFNFRAPRLQLTRNKSHARVFWQAQGQIIADHKQQMVNRIGKGNRTSLYSSWMAPTDAQRKLHTLLADLGKGTSWLNMYKMTAKACEAIQPLPHNFAMPKRWSHTPLMKNVARVHWQQRGSDVAAHTKHLKQLHKTCSKTQVSSQYVVVAATRRQHEALVTLLQNGTSWLNMYQTTVTACHELSSSRGREELAEAAGLTYQMDVFWRAVLCERQEMTQTCTA